MRILLLTPQPFYQERGTPIAIRLLARALCEAGHRVDLLTYSEGDGVEMEGLSLYRIPQTPFTRNVPIGFSLRKLWCDGLLFWRMVGRLRRRRYDVIHAVEESIFFTLLIPRRTTRRVVYDMDSSMADQLMEKWRYLRPLVALLYTCERLAIRRADHVLPVCQALARKVEQVQPGKPVTVLEDVALESAPSGAPIDDLRRGLPADALLVLYVGNLEHYQGVDHLIRALARSPRHLYLTLVGGRPDDIERLQALAADLGLGDRCRCIGPRPVADLVAYLAQADILVSPRLKGVNTPMKVYSYLAAGKALLASDIDSHTQVLDARCACLVPATVAGLAQGLKALSADAPRRRRLGQAARERARARHSYRAYRDKVTGLYAQLERSIRAA